MNEYGALVELEGDRWQLRFVRRVPHPIEKVWRAITEPEHLEHWFPTTIEGDRRAGAPLRFSFPDHMFPAFDGEMLACQPPTLLEFAWGPDTIRLELRAVADGTELTLHDTLEQRGKAARDGSGWHACLDALVAHLDGDQDSRRWLGQSGELRPKYVERLGPEASTIGPPAGVE